MVSATCFVDEFPVFIPKLRIMLMPILHKLPKA